MQTFITCAWSSWPRLCQPIHPEVLGLSLALLCLRTTSFEATLGQDYSLAGASVRIVIDDRGLFLDVLILKRIKDIWGQIPT